MKKTNLIMMLLLGAQISVNAQVTINSSDNPMAAGYSYTLRGKGIYSAHETDFVPGQSGPDAVWDFSSFGNNVTTLSYTLTTCTGNECDSFSGTTFLGTVGDTKEYYTRDASKIELRGSMRNTSTMDFYSVYSNPITVVVFPLTYNTTFSDTYNYNESNTINTEVTTHNSVYSDGIADAYGTIKTPVGTYNNVIRVQISSRDEYTKAWMQEGGNYNTTVYNWYQKGIGEPVMSMIKYDRIGGGPGGVVGGDSYTYYYTTTLPKNETSINGSFIPEKSVEVYPNPARNQINIKRENVEVKKISITNMVGANIYQSEFGKDELIMSVNTSTWTAGLYFVNVEYKDGRINMQKVIIE